MNDWWYIIVALAAVLIMIIYAAKTWLELPKAEKIADVKEWLKWAVTEAEKKLKTGTGQLKLREVYNMFVSTYPELRYFITFERFSEWVDDALKWLNHALETNKNLREYVYGNDD